MKAIFEQFDDKLVDLAWSLWNELGVAGIDRKHKHCLIAIEELIILTAVIAEADPRLRDEALDWCSRYHHFVSVHRLRSLVKALGETVYIPFSVFAKTLNAHARSNWPIFSNVVPLNFKPSGKSTRPRCEQPALVGLRLRAFFGVGARADLLTFILTQNTMTFFASDIDEIGYSKRSLADLLDLCVQSGFFVTSIVRNQRKYEFIKYDQMKAFVGELPTIVPPWTPILELLIAIREIFQQSTKNSTTSNVILIRNKLKNMQEFIRKLNLPTPNLLTDPAHVWQAFTDWSLKTAHAYSQGYFPGFLEVRDDFEKIVSCLMQTIYAVDDCLDGLQFIISHSKDESLKHISVFRESYELCIVYLNELVGATQKLVNFPYHQLMDSKTWRNTIQVLKKPFAKPCKSC